MIESSSWGSTRDQAIHRAVATIHLKRCHQFCENVAGRSPEDGESSLEHIVEGPIRLVYKVNEDVGIPTLVEMENKTLSKLLAAVAGTCREIGLLKAEAVGFYDKISAHGEASADDGAIGIPLSDLQDLSVYVNRVSSVIRLTVRQLSSLAGGPYDIYLPVLIVHLIDAFTILVTLDEIISAHPSILDRWDNYRIHVRSIGHNPEQFNVSASELALLETLLTDLRNQLLTKTLFSRAVDGATDASASPVTGDHLATYLRNTVADVESKSADCSAINQNWIRINVGLVVTAKLFGTVDKKIAKRIAETNKRHYAVALAGSVVWVPARFLGERLPREFGNSVCGPQVGEKILAARTQKLSTAMNNFLRESMAWCGEMRSAMARQAAVEKTAATGVLRVALADLRLEKKRSLLVQVLTILSQIGETVSFVTNLHGALSKPMSRGTVQLVCRLVEVQKSLETTFYVLGPAIVNCQSQVLQYLCYRILCILETARRGLTRKDKGYSKEGLDALSLIGLSMRLLNGPASADRRLIARCALAAASQMTDSFKDDQVTKLRFYLDNYDTVADLFDRVAEVCDYSVLLHHRNVIPAYLSLVTDGNLDIGHIAHLMDAFNNVVARRNASATSDAKIAEQGESLRRHVLEPACREIETSLRLHVYAHMKLDDGDPFKTGVKNGGRIVRSPPLPVASNLICAKRFVEHYLDDTFYNLTTVALHDWRTYGTMHRLANYKLGLDAVRNHLPTQTLEQGVDALEIMRNIHVFVSKYLYNLNTQTFVERTSANKHLDTIGIRHIANSIRTHGTGIMNTTVNFVYQFLRVKLHTFSQFLFDEHIKSRLMRDIRFVKNQRENGATPYTYERAEKFQKGIRKLGMTENGLSYLDQFRQLITQIGNALGYVRLIRSGGLHASSNAVSFLPDIDSATPFESTCRDLDYSVATQIAAKRLEDDISNLVRNFTEGIQYFKLLVDVFASAFRDSKSYHLQQFYAIVPPLTLSFIDNALASKEKIFKKNKTGAAFTDDGFAMGLAYINALLDQSAELDGLQWFKTVDGQINAERLAAENRDNREDLKLQQTGALTLKRLAERSAEFQLLYYSLSGARVFFKQSDP